MQRSQIVLLLYLGRALLLDASRRAPNRGSRCSWGLSLEFSNSAKFQQLRMSTSTSPFNNLRKRYKKSEHMSWHEQIPVDVHGWPNNPGKLDMFPLCHGVKRVKHWAKLLTRSYKTKTKVLDSVDHSLLSQCDLCSSGHLQYVGGSNEINWKKKTFLILHIPSYSVHWLRKFAGLPQLLTECYRQMGTMQYAVLPVRDLRVSYPQRECGV